MTIWIKVAPALNNLQGLICHKNQPTNQKAKNLPKLDFIKPSLINNGYLEDSFNYHSK